MADKLMFVSNNDTQNYPFSGSQLVVETFGELDTYLYEPTNQNLIKSLKLLSQRYNFRD